VAGSKIRSTELVQILSVLIPSISTTMYHKPPVNVICSK